LVSANGPSVGAPPDRIEVAVAVGDRASPCRILPPWSDTAAWNALWASSIAANASGVIEA